MRIFCRSRSMFMTKVLSVQDLRKDYGDTVAVDGISFDVGLGEIVGLLGPNGAGKTTTINMVLGVLEPTAGSHPDRRAGHSGSPLASAPAHQLRSRLCSTAG